MFSALACACVCQCVFLTWSLMSGLHTFEAFSHILLTYFSWCVFAWVVAIFHRHRRHHFSLWHFNKTVVSFISVLGSNQVATNGAPHPHISLVYENVHSFKRNIYFTCAHARMHVCVLLFLSALSVSWRFCSHFE